MLFRSRSSERTERELVLEIRDNGRGMDAATLKRLGQPFFRADKARSREEGGAGLGLALCRAITEAHGASMEYESTVGEGTTVRITFASGQTEVEYISATSNLVGSSLLPVPILLMIGVFF